MWWIYAVLTFGFWGFADLFYKKANNEKEDKLTHWKTIIVVGLVMGIHAFCILAMNDFSFNFGNIISYLPVSLCYIISMGIGYAGLKYIELSIASPVQNSSGAIATLLCIIFFSYKLRLSEGMGIFFIALGVFLLALLESKETRKNVQISMRKYTFSLLAIAFPILYCVFDGAGTFLDALYLDELEIITETEALLAYEFTFLICAIIGYIYLTVIKKERFNIFKQKDNISASLLETAGQFFYVYAMADNATISAVLVSSYCVLSLILSRVFLKEKLNSKQYFLIALVFLGIILTAI